MYEVNSWHPVTLPSQGRFYGDKMPGGNITVTPWTTQQEEDLVRHGANEDFSLKVLERNVRLPEGMSIKDLLVGDQFFLLVQLRINSLSPFFSLTWGCEHCDNRLEEQLDLRLLECRVPDDDETDPFDLVLPQCGKTVALHYPKVSDQIAAKEYAAKSKGTGGALAFRFARQIETVDGHSLKWDEKRDFVAKHGILDFQLLRDSLNKRQIGYTLVTPIQCRRCGESSDVGLPLENGFFRPDRADLERAAAELVDRDPKGDELPDQ